MRPGQDRSPTWFQPAAELPAALLARLHGIKRQGRGRLAARLCQGTGPAMPRTSAADWNTDQMPRLREPGIARVPGHARDRVQVEGDVGPRPLTTVEYWPSWRQGRWQRMDAPDHPAPLRPATRTWPLYWRDCVRS